MKFRKATLQDSSAILEIVQEAQKALKEANIDQWQNGYPNEESIHSDINAGISYVVEKNNKVVATVAYLFEEDPNYITPLSGKWIGNQNYACIHRIAIKTQEKGSEVSSYLMEQLKQLALEKEVDSIRVDTHKDNFRMQRYLKKHGFIKIGVIALQDGALRDAFEYLLETTH